MRSSPAPTTAISAGQSGDKGSSPVRRPGDPNEKFGAAGFGEHAYITGELAIPYRINFENLGPGSDPTPAQPATAPAQRVVVTDQLSSNLDWSTFEFTAAGFGDTFVNVPAGRQYHFALVPVTIEGERFNVEVELTFDPSTGWVWSVFQSVDPNTSLPPEVMVGFLHPEDGTGRGKGFISYLVTPKAGLPTGAEIRNVALIKFDGETIIATNQIDPLNPGKGTDAAKEALNTIDAGGPASHVEPLPAVAEPGFSVSWLGADDPGGSGIASFDIYVSENGGAFLPWLLGTTDSAAVFDGISGRTYAFYSIARDNVGHVEAAPASPDVVIAVRSPNEAPQLAPIGDRSVEEGGVLSFAVVASDPNGGDVLTFSLEPGAPAGASVNSTTGLFRWTAGDGPASFDVTVRVTDNGSPALSATRMFRITVSNAAPTVAVAGAASRAEGSLYTLTLGAVVDPGSDTVSQYLVHWGDGSTDTYEGPGAVTHTYADGPATRTIRVDLIDEDGTHVNAGSLSVEVTNVPPTLTLSGAPAATVGSSYVLGLASSDPGSDAITRWTISWGDGVVETIPGDPAAVTHTYASPGLFNITATATDEDGTTAANTVAVVVTLPTGGVTAGISGPATGVRGQPREFVLTASDASGSFTFAINWADGSTQTVLGPSGFTVEHVFEHSGTYVVQVTARDKDDAVSPIAQHTVSVTAYDFHGAVLTIGGTPDDDILLIHPGGGSDGIKIHVNGAISTFTGVERIVAFGQAGNDLIHVTESVRVPVELHGGAGNDILNGGGGPSILAGDDGNDLIVGGRGRNLLIGGFGTDILTGLGGDDILISGDFMRGSPFAVQQSAAREVLTRWSDPGSYANRVAALVDYVRVRILDDDDVDLLVGGGGLDWFLADRSGPVKDLILDRAFAEMVTDID